MPSEETGTKTWRVYRFETPDGRYAELASNELAPEQIQLPPHAAEYRFVGATEMVPKKNAVLVQELFDAAQWLLEVESEVDPDPSDLDGATRRLAQAVGQIEAADDAH